MKQSYLVGFPLTCDSDKEGTSSQVCAVIREDVGDSGVSQLEERSRNVRSQETLRGAGICSCWLEPGDGDTASR